MKLTSESALKIVSRKSILVVGVAKNGSNSYTSWISIGGANSGLPGERLFEETVGTPEGVLDTLRRNLYAAHHASGKLEGDLSIADIEKLLEMIAPKLPSGGYIEAREVLV